MAQDKQIELRQPILYFPEKPPPYHPRGIWTGLWFYFIYGSPSTEEEAEEEADG